MSPAEHAAATACPKSMTHGPCGGTTPMGGCEVDADMACPFVADRTLGRWRGGGHAGVALSTPTAIVDFRPSTDRGTNRAALEILGDSTLLIGEHLDDPAELRPRTVAESLVAEGASLIATIAGRGPTRAEREETLRRLIDAGVEAVHCVTGDHPAARFGPGVTAHFALDSLELVAMAHGHGVPVSAAESPASAPTAVRPRRALDKQSAGAGLLILNHAGGIAVLRRFLDRVRALGVTVPVVAPVPIVVDETSAIALARLPGVRLDDDYVDDVRRAGDARALGIEFAIDTAAALLGAGFDAVNLSGPAGPFGPVQRAEIAAEIIAGLSDRQPSRSP